MTTNEQLREAMKSLSDNLFSLEAQSRQMRDTIPGDDAPAKDARHHMQLAIDQLQACQMRADRARMLLPEPEQQPAKRTGGWADMDDG